MPFSTYLREPAPRDDRPAQNDTQQQQQQQQHPYTTQNYHPQQAQYQPQEQYSGYGVYSPADAMKHYGNYYTPSASPHDAHSSAGTAGPSSSGSSKHYPPLSPSTRGGNNGLFQMPSFLMGGFGGALTPNTMGMFDFVSAPYAPAHDSGKPWQTTKYYTLEEQQEQRNDIAATAPASAATSSHAHAHTAGPAASPFGYLNAESPQEQAANAQEETMDEADATANVSLDDPSAIAEVDTTQPPELYAPVPTAGLPVYSQSGFDMLSILARVARRSNPTISLGPVDLTCAFVVSDVRSADAPIVYASPTFYELTGYAESEVVGRNCRFLQAPGGRVARSETRRFTSPDAVRELRFALDKDREVQVSLINYRKDGRPFVNRVSIVPIPAEDAASEIAFHVGFQVDLNEQPGLIAQRIQDGKFYSGGDSLFKSLTPADRSARGMGKKLRALLSDPSFQSAAHLTTSSNSTPSSTATVATSASNSNSDSSAPTLTSKSSAASKPDTRDERQWLNLLMLEHMPDFIHVLSLKGHFLYVSPGVTRVLGYAPADLVGKSVSDFCHPSDAVPLLRELKESTGQAVVSSESGNVPSDTPEAQTHMGQRTVDLLFRMRTNTGGYAWIESIGRLHVEAGKGRKAIVLSGRICAMPNLRWGAISRAGGLLGPCPSAVPNTTFTDSAESGEAGKKKSSTEREFWAMLCGDGLFLVAGMGVRDLLGWGAGEMIGRSIRDFIVNSEADGNHASTEQILTALGKAYVGENGMQFLSCRMKKRDGQTVWMQLMLYANEPGTTSGRVIVQFKLLFPPTSSPTIEFQTYSPAAYQNAAFAFSFSPSQTSPSYPLLDNSTSSTTARAARILHLPTTNVFAEFETHRGTSWQYELQQLKFANDKIREEVNALETRQRMQQRSPWVGDAQM